MKIILSEKQLKKLVVEQTWKDNVKSLFQPTTRKFTVPKGEDLTGKFSPFNLAKEIFKMGDCDKSQIKILVSKILLCLIS